MAYTKIWKIVNDVNAATEYISQDKKVKFFKPEEFEKNICNSVNDVENIEISIKMDNSLNYITKDAKTEFKRYVSGINCSENNAAEEFMHNKQRYYKKSKIQGYHCVQSFAPGEISPEDAHILGLKLANELWGDAGYQVLLATHIDRDHIHNHFVINSVSLDGKSDPCCYHKKIAYVSDKLVKEAGYSIINDIGKNPTTFVHLSKRCQRAKLIVDEAILKAKSLDEWVDLMNDSGYEVSISPNRQYWTIKHDEWKRPVRLIRLGSDYTNAVILKKIQNKEIISDSGINKDVYRTEDRFNRINIRWKDTIQYKYFIANLKLGVDIRKYKVNLKGKTDSKEEASHRKLMDKITLLSSNNITYENIQKHISNLELKIRIKQQEQEKIRKACHNLRRNHLPTYDIQVELDRVNSEISNLQYQRLLLNEIKEESISVCESEQNYQYERNIDNEINL